jgi:hypothetical protein
MALYNRRRGSNKHQHGLQQPSQCQEEGVLRKCTHTRYEEKKKKKKKLSACHGEGSVVGLQLRVRFVPAALLAVLKTALEYSRPVVTVCCNYRIYLQ